MSGDNHNQADPPDLDAIERWLSNGGGGARPIVRTLVAEARRLRAEVVELEAALKNALESR